MQILQGETVIGVGPWAAELPVSSAPLRAGRCHGESLELLRCVFKGNILLIIMTFKGNPDLVKA